MAFSDRVQVLLCEAAEGHGSQLDLGPLGQREEKLYRPFISRRPYQVKRIVEAA
jgi:hypothetical protein